MADRRPTHVRRAHPHLQVLAARRQPGGGWLQTGTVIAALLWSALTALLALYYASSDRMNETYGPLLGVIVLLTWAYATGLATYFGMSLAAQLEAIRAGVPGPRTLRRYNETVRDPAETQELEDVRPLTAEEQRVAGVA
ncbi:MAG: hypothetical protein GEU78_06270 [Actinobacteria bacterium]|nr:hypothetical protein [Actinomycetota bacterium]